ncbi:uncharacterized protein F4822DRAFT_442208 [Hypoxylon trugodes]|uniref:uncharacterized protein n=1 Tax=Hypoxylon trugodes TaxID=326681 RepID=UPI00219DDBEA|nr:uncharacterized protein F4822DRAFT_442208 [Hypoxylon trugodes]KAI1391073.1 hypothetical protein F4822DRAFT_442208 [Hypoxylon trugodes]
MESSDLETLRNFWGKDRVLLIGIDLGTTFSGVSYGVWKDPSVNGNVSPNPVVCWPGVGNLSTKIETAVSYDDSGDCSWGWLALEQPNVMSWFKLLLPGDGELHFNVNDLKEVQQAKATMQRLGKRLVDVVGDYLRMIFQYTLQYIRQERGDVADVLPFHIIFAVPAIWKEKALDYMRQDIRLSCITNARPNGVAKTTYRFVTEPEAAAMAVVPEFTEPFEIREVVEGSGGLCGAAFLDNSFRNFMKKKSLDEGLIWDELHREDQLHVLTAWEGRIKNDEVRTLFDSLKPEIEKLVRRQVIAVQEKTLRPPKYILLVGGFGQSPYLYNSLKRTYNGHVTVFQGKGSSPSSCVSRGAVICGMKQQVLIHSRISRFSYGFVLDKPFEKGVHHKDDKYFDESRGYYMAQDQMEWLVKRGDDVAIREPQTFYYERRIDHRARGRREFREVIWESRSSKPSNRKADLDNDEDFMVAKSILITTPPVEQLPKIKHEGTLWYLFAYDLKVEVSGASIKLSAKWTKDRSVELIAECVNVVVGA